MLKLLNMDLKVFWNFIYLSILMLSVFLKLYFVNSEIISAWFLFWHWMPCCTRLLYLPVGRCTAMWAYGEAGPDRWCVNCLVHTLLISYLKGEGLLHQFSMCHSGLPLCRSMLGWGEVRFASWILMELGIGCVNPKILVLQLFTCSILCYHARVYLLIMQALLIVVACLQKAWKL